jgi:predicted transport protein
MKYVKSERIVLKRSPDLDEKWVQERIAEDPAILGLGDLVLKDTERMQPKAGRLDLLLQDPDDGRRYEVEIQLGNTDESHLVRTLEYWDIERKRFPQYDHCAVIIAEDITSRFLNVISMFNGFIPLIAIQMKALKVCDNLVLDFTTVLDELTLGLLEEEEEAEETDRAFWETKRGTKETMALTDQILAIIQEFEPKISLKYNKAYIGLARDGRPNNFALMQARKKYLRLSVKVVQNEELEEALKEGTLDTADYHKRSGRLRLQLRGSDVAENRPLLSKLLELAYGGR